MSNGFMRKFEHEDCRQREVIPFKTEIVLTDRFTVYTVHLMRNDGKTICNQFADGECMRKDNYQSPIYKFKNCKKCFTNKTSKPSMEPET